MKASVKLKISIALLFFIFFIILNFTGLDARIKNSFYLISSPLQEKLWKAGESTSDFLTGIFQAKNLKKEADELFLINKSLIAEIAELKESEAENSILRETLNIEPDKEMQFVLSRIISKDIANEIILINKGKKDGVAKGSFVITLPQKSLLGRITEIYDNFSEVTLITNKNSLFEAKILDKDIYGAAKGKGSSDLYFELVPKEKELSVSDVVVTAALGGDFPAGILVGSIREVYKSDIEPFQTAEVIPAFDIKKLDYLFVIMEF